MLMSSLSGLLLEVYRFDLDVLVLDVFEQTAGWSLHHRGGAETLLDELKPGAYLGVIGTNTAVCTYQTARPHRPLWIQEVAPGTAAAAARERPTAHRGGETLNRDSFIDFRPPSRRRLQRGACGINS